MNSSYWNVSSYQSDVGLHKNVTLDNVITFYISKFLHENTELKNLTVGFYNDRSHNELRQVASLYFRTNVSDYYAENVTVASVDEIKNDVTDKGTLSHNTNTVVDDRHTKLVVPNLES